MYVQYGCGLSAPPEWQNFDSSLTLKWERLPVLGTLWTKNAQRFPANVRVGDIVRGLPVAPASCKGVYASHVLEHLTLADFHTALANTRDILASGGIFRMIVPDLAWIGREYMRRLEAHDPEASHYFVEATDLGEKSRRPGAFAAVHRMFNTSRHMWMWDEFSLRRALEQSGFERIRRCGYGDCGDPMFSLVEDPSRFERAVAMEGCRP